MTPSKLITLVLFVTLGLFISSLAIAGWDPNEEKKAKEAVAAFKKQDPGMKAFFDKAAGYAVFPTVGKGGIGIGGAHGKGTVFQAGRAIGATTLSQVTIGFQFGGQTYSQIIFFKDKATLDKFKTEAFEFSAQASAVAVTSGAAANADYSGGVAVFTMAKGGLMYEASIGGQKFSFTPK